MNAANQLNLMITSAIQQVSWITTFRTAAKNTGIQLRIFAACTNPELSPACLLADSGIAIPAVTHPQYIERLLETCLQLEIDLLVPGSPRELLKLADAKPLFEARGTKVLAPGTNFVSVSRDPVDLDRIAVLSGAKSRGLVDRSDVARRPGNYLWPMEVLPRKWLNEELHAMCLHHSCELSRIPCTAPVLMTSHRSGRKTIVLGYFNEQGRLEWRKTMRTGILKAGGIQYVETIEDNEATIVADQMSAHFHQAYGPVVFVFGEECCGGFLLENMIPVLPKEFSLVERAGSQLAHRLLLRATGCSMSQLNPQWHSGMRLLFYPSPMILLRPEMVS
jgi:carbamoyl-phosphate synthase large subunit